MGVIDRLILFLLNYKLSIALKEREHMAFVLFNVNMDKSQETKLECDYHKIEKLIKNIHDIRDSLK